MARFDLESYATVAERLAKFHHDYPDGRIVTDWANSDAYQEGPKTWVVKTTIYLSSGDQANNLAKATGYASETDGTGGANNVAALPNAESSSLGRALMIMGYSMNKDPKTLASREEMQKVQSVADHATLDWIAKLDEMDTKAEVRGLYAEALRNQAPKQVLDAITAKGKTAK
jgi:hypothetical protein